MERLINKLNNIEKNVGWVERYYRLGGKFWYIAPEELWCEGRIASKEEIEGFLKLKKQLDKDDGFE